MPNSKPKAVARALVVVASLARLTMIELRARIERVRDRRLTALAARDRRLSEVRLLEAELKIKDQRMARVPIEHRPRYLPTERLQILILRGSRGWSAAQAARKFLLTPQTIGNWTRRLAKHGEGDLVRLPTPVNRFPDFVRLVVRQLRASVPGLGHLRAAQMLATAGLQISGSTVARFSKAPPLRAPAESSLPKRSTGRVVTAKRPHDLWHVDLTTMPTIGGFWIPWLPFTLPQCWPFAYWVAVVLDHYTRAVVAKAIFKKQPTAADICVLLSTAERSAGRAPRAIVTDRGVQFQSEYENWCRRRGVRPRFGAIGQHGSIAVVERFIRSMKQECLRLISAPTSIRAINSELDAYLIWYHRHRPHQGLGGQTPVERRRAPSPPIKKRRIRKRKERLRPLELRLRFVAGRQHLPIVKLRRAA